MTAINMGLDSSGSAALIDLEELLATRLLVQGNSGSGKSHLLRRLLEESAGLVQQIVIDPEGDFVSLADAFSHVVIDAAGYSLSEIGRLAARIREHRASVVLSVEGLEMEGQMLCVGAFLSALFDAPREHWYPALVVVDEAQVFAPAVAGEVSDEARRSSLGAMTNLMCRGRKRGLAGVIATQRLAKLAKNVAAEASNFLMGRTFLDIDMLRAADLLGMERRQAEAIRDLQRGEFLSLGPAISRRPVSIRIGAVRTGARAAALQLVPLPLASAADLKQLLMAPDDKPEPPRPAPPEIMPASKLIEVIAAPPGSAVGETCEVAAEAQDEIANRVLSELVRDGGDQPATTLYRAFLVRCRQQGVSVDLDMAAFARRLAIVRAGIDDETPFEEALALGNSLPEEMLAPFLAIARAAREEEACPTDGALAELYRTSSVGRARRMLDYIEGQGLIDVKVDLSGKRSICLPSLGWTTLPAQPDPERLTPLGQAAAREPRLARGR